MRASKSLRCLNKNHGELRGFEQFFRSVEIYPHHRIHVYLNIFTYTFISSIFSKISVVRNIAVPWVRWVHHQLISWLRKRPTEGGPYPLQKIHLFESMMFWELPLLWDVFYLPGRVKNRCVNFKQHKPPMMKGEDGKFWLHVWRLIVSSEVRING